ncbi:MAG: ABC transporter permease [Alphaproteobacteria bacterium]|nr:ABC transporter permease [Alphaproteobacteria bacterium]
MAAQKKRTTTAGALPTAGQGGNLPPKGDGLIKTKHPLAQNKWLAAFINLPPWLFLLLLFVAPISLVWVYSFGEKVGLIDIKASWVLDNYARVLSPIYLLIFAKSFLTVAVATIICIIVAYPVAIGICFIDKKWQPWLLLLVILPFWINVLIRTYGLISIIRDQGTINNTLSVFWSGAQYLVNIFGLSHIVPWLTEDFKPIPMMNTGFSVYLGLIYSYIPFMILPIYTALEKIDKSYIEASLDLGASQWRTFRSIILPMTSQGLSSGIILVFIPALGAFYIPTLLGNPNWYLIGNIIEQQFHSSNDLPFGSALSFLLMYVTFGALAARSYFEGRQEQKIKGS